MMLRLITLILITFSVNAFAGWSYSDYLNYWQKSSSGTTSTSSGTSSSGSTSTSTPSSSTTSSSTPASTSSSGKLGLLVPAYFDPSSDQNDWNTLISAASHASLMVIMNPNNGPGTSQDQSYVNNINSVNTAGGKVIGYVHTSYGSRPLADAEKEVDNYFAWYKVKGIFLDEMASSATSANLNYYKSLASYIRGKSSAVTIVGNPGGGFDQAFATNKVADVFVDAEDVQSNVHTMTQPSWVSNFAASTFAAMSIQTSSDPTETTWLKGHRRMGWVYTTTLPLNPNPYGSLPSDFTSSIQSL